MNEENIQDTMDKLSQLLGYSTPDRSNDGLGVDNLDMVN